MGKEVNPGTTPGTAAHTQESDRQLRLLVENMGDMVTRHLPDTTITYASPSCKSLLGYSPTQMVGTKASDLIYPEDAEMALGELQRAVQSRDDSFRVQHRMTRRDGSCVWVEVVGRLLYNSNDLTELQCIVRDISENKRAEAALCESEERLRTVVQTMPVLVDAFDERENVIVWNRECERVTGYRAEEVVGNPEAMRMLYPDDGYREWVLATVKEAAGEFRNLELKLTCKDGQQRTVLWSNLSRSHPIAGWTTWAVGLDITDRQQARDLLMQQSERLRLALQAARMGTWEWDLAADRVSWSPETMAIFGTTPELFGGDYLAYASFVPLTDRDAVNTVVQRFLDDAKESSVIRYDHRIIRSDGTLGWIEVRGTLFLDEHRKPSYMVGVCADISERKRIENALRESETRHRQVVNTMSDGLAIAHTDGHLVFVNSAFCRMYGYAADELIGMHALKLIHPSYHDVFGTFVEELAATGKFSGNTIDMRKDGTTFDTDIQGARIQFEGKDCLLAVVRDITQRKRAEREREELIAVLENQNAELEQFTYTVSHDLKSPLITIKGYVGMLLECFDTTDADTMRGDLHRVLNAADKMEDLLEDLLELSRIGRLTNPCEEVPLTDMVNDALSLVEGRLSALNVAIEVEEDLPSVHGDRNRLVEVLQNLIDNAAKYSRQAYQPRIEIGGYRAEGETICFVKDNGIGIEPAYQERVFGLFNQLDAKEEGTGIGLALVKRIVEFHCGRIWIESDGEGNGSTFFFSIPDEPTSVDLNRLA